MSPASGNPTGVGAAERFQLGKILVADADPDLLGLVEATLRAEGHEVVTARTGWEAVRVAREQLPWLLILDTAMPDMRGYEICSRLRSDWRFADRGIILLTPESLPDQRSLGLAAGADDFVLKPLDLVELADRVRLTRRRVVEMRSSSPLTGLPGNVYIHQELERRVAAGDPVALLYVDIDDFKAYNDHYGFLRGDEAIRALAGVLRRSLEGRPPAFLGHVGGDDFVVLTEPEEAEQIARDVISGFEGIVGELHEREDAARGWFEVTDRRGAVRRQGLLTISIGVATNVGTATGDHRRLVDLASEMKEFAKSRPGNAVAVDRRGRPAPGPPGHPAGPRRGLHRRLARLAAAALVTLGLVAGPTTVALAENARPGDVLWPVRLWVEDARLVLERNDERDIILRLEFASRRLGDLRHVLAQGSALALVENVTENLAEHTEVAMATFWELPPKERSALRSHARMFLGQSIQILQELAATACQGDGDLSGPPEAACLGLRKALENTTGAMDHIHQAAGSSGGAPDQGQPTGWPGQGRDQGPRGHGLYHGPPGHAKDTGPPAGDKARKRPAQDEGKAPPAKGKESQDKGTAPPGKGMEPPAQDKEPPEKSKEPPQDKGQKPPGHGTNAKPTDREDSPVPAGKGQGGT